MAYYPIKCIYCMETIRMEDRCVKLASEEIKSKNPLADREENADLALSMDADLLGDGGGGRQRILYKSLAQLRQENKIVREEIMPIEISREFRDIPECQKNFVQSVEVRDLEIEGKQRSGVMRNWYCPVCHNAIIRQAGKMPIYLVSLMGPSSAGKTVYLTILHMLLSGKNYNLPYGCISMEKLGKTGNEFEKFASDVYKNILPGTTGENRKDPYMLQISYSVDTYTQKTNKQCLLGLIDMRGEMLQGDHNDELEDNTVPQFRKADGFIMMVDPETLEGVYTRLPEQNFGDRKVFQLQQILSSMKEVISDYITSDMGTITKPSVVALTKQDILLKNNASLGIPLQQPVIAPQFRMQPGANLWESYFEPMNHSTQGCIQYLSGSFTNFLNNTFQNPYFVSVSALGSSVQIQGNKIDNYAKINPVRVEEPLIHLLMDMNFIPPFYMDEFYRDPQAVMEIWGENFAEVWNGTENAEPEETKGKDKKKEKKGLFGSKK